MAAKREQPKDITACCLCNKTYQDPRILPCIHTLCLKCLKEVGSKTNKGPGDRMPCPLCRKKFTIPEDGYTALQKNFFMEKIIEMGKIASPSGDPGLCDACIDSESESVSVSKTPLADIFCIDCQQKMCQECSMHHRKYKLNRNHQIIAAVDFPSKVQMPRLSNCEKHKREHKLYCSECKELLCESCFGKSHQNHRLQDVVNTVERFTNEIRDRITCLEVCESKIFEKKDILTCELQEYCENAESLELEVLAQRDATIKLVREHADIIRQHIYQLKGQKQSEVEAEIESTGRFLVWLESLKVFCADVMSKGSASDICSAVDRLKAAEEIKEQIESEIEIKTFLRKMSFQTSDLEEFVKTEDYNIIGTIQECQKKVKRCETETASDNTSRHRQTKMDNDRSIPISSSNGIRTRINHLKQELENERRRICELEMEKKALEERINDLCLELGIKRLRKSASGLPMTQTAQPLSKQVPPPMISMDYKQTPYLVKTLQGVNGSRDKGRIFALTILDDELFLGCFIVEVDHSVVEVYDIKTFSFKRRWQVKYLSQSGTGVARIRCMTSCSRYKCLFACVSIVGDFGSSEIQRTDANGSNAKDWRICRGSRIPNLSVTREGNVLITGCYSLFEYTRNGVLIHVIKLPSNLGIVFPMHALKLANGNYLISHGEKKNAVNRVVLLSKSGQITRSFGESPLKQVREVCNPRVLNNPVYIAVDKLGNILVADRGNSRIVVLDSDLEFVSAIVCAERIEIPRCMCVDADRRQLFVCEGMKKFAVYDFCV